MIRRTFMKALMASPLGFLIPKAKVGYWDNPKRAKYMRGEGLKCIRFTKGTTGGATITFDEIELMQQEADDWAEFRLWQADHRKMFTVYKDGKVIDKFPI